MQSALGGLRNQMESEMFIVEYRTISRLGMVYPTRIATISLHKATSAAEAAAHILKTTPNVEVVNVEYRSVGA